MKLLLLQPPVRDFYDTDVRLQPLGLCMLKAAVKKYLPHIKVIVKDYHQGYGRKTLPYPGELSYLRDYYAWPDGGPFSTFHQFYQFGAGFEDAAEDVYKEKPDLVGISSLFTSYYREALACAEAIKKKLNVPVIMGGPHVTAEPLCVLNDPNVDFIIRGEGERPLVELLKVLENREALENVPNLGFKKQEKPILNPMGEPYAIDDLPWAGLSDCPVDRYLYENKPVCFLMTSRGCPHQCGFCSVHLTFGKGYRQRKVEDIVEEIKYRYEAGYRVFDFEDDNLTFHRENFKQLLQRLIKEMPGRDVRLLAMNGVSYLSLDAELLELMKQAGFRSLNISLVSSNSRTLSRIKRPHTLEKFLEAVRQGHLLGFDLVAYQILGLPYETLDHMKDTLILLASLPVLIGVSIFYQVPGSPMAGEFPALTPADWIRARSTAMAVETAHFKRDDLYTLFITARIINFIKGLNTDRKNIPVRELLDDNRKINKRNELGADLLLRLFTEKVLHVVTKKGHKTLSRFQADLFFKVWEKMPYIISQKGSVIVTQSSEPNGSVHTM